MKARLIAASDADSWAAALAGLKHGIAHTHAFATCLANSAKCDVFLFVAESADGARAVCPVAERTFEDQRDIYTPYGFGGFVGRGDLSSLRDAWLSFVMSRKYVASYLVQHPVLTPTSIVSQWGDAQKTDRKVFVVDLKVAQSERWRRVSARKRTELRRWLNTAEPVKDQTQLAAAFVELYPSFAERRSMAPLYHFSKETLEELIALPETCLVGVRGEDNKVSCVAMMAATKECGDYLFMASSADGEAEGAGVLWLGLQELAVRGVEMCNLGGGIKEGDGVAEMKRRLGGSMLPIPTIKEVFDQVRYRALCVSAGRSPDELGFFPAYQK